MTIQDYAKTLIEEHKDYGTFEGYFLIVEDGEVWKATDNTNMLQCEKLERVI